MRACLPARSECTLFYWLNQNLNRHAELVIVRQGGGIELSIEAQLLNNRPVAAPAIIRVQIASHVNKIVEQEPGALGLAQIENMKRAPCRGDENRQQNRAALSFVWL